MFNENRIAELRIKQKADVANQNANEGALIAADSLSCHWPEYLMEAGEACVYLFSACAVATLLWHPSSPIQAYLPSDAVRRILMGSAMAATIISILLSPSSKQSAAHFNPTITFTFYRLQHTAGHSPLHAIRGPYEQVGGYRGAEAQRGHRAGAGLVPPTAPACGAPLPMVPGPLQRLVGRKGPPLLVRVCTTPSWNSH